MSAVDLKKSPRENMVTATVNIFAMLDTFVTKIKKSSGLSERDAISIQSVKTGFRFLDHFTGGLAEGDYVVLAGQSSTGKTTLALNIALNVVLSAAKDVLIFLLVRPKR